MRVLIWFLFIVAANVASYHAFGRLTGAEPLWAVLYAFCLTGATATVLWTKPQKFATCD